MRRKMTPPPRGIAQPDRSCARRMKRCGGRIFGAASRGGRGTGSHDKAAPAACAAGAIAPWGKGYSAVSGHCDCRPPREAEVRGEEMVFRHAGMMKPARASMVWQMQASWACPLFGWRPWGGARSLAPDRLMTGLDAALDPARGRRCPWGRRIGRLRRLSSGGRRLRAALAGNDPCAGGVPDKPLLLILQGCAGAYSL